MELQEKIEKIAKKEDFVTFIEELQSDLQTNGSDWENVTLDRYLEALGAFTNAIDFAYKNEKREFPKDVNWRVFAEILFAGSALRVEFSA